MEGKGTGENMGLKEKVQDMMERAVSDCVVAGINLLVEKDGRELCYCQAGMADREENRPMERDTIFRLYSQTKPVAAAAAMILMERGQMDLIQPVSDFLPSFAGQSYSGEKAGIGEDAAGAGVSQPVRIFDLLRMTSGLVYPDEAIQAGRETAAVFEEIDRRLRSGQDMTTREVAERLAGCTLAFEPGSSWHYGTSADVLGAVIEAVSGMRFGQFLEKELFGPLGMKDTAFYVPQEKQDRLAAVYEAVSQKGRNTLVRFEKDHLGVRNRMEKAPGFESGGAGLASTLDDYMRFARMLLCGGELEGVRILRPATVAYLTGGELTQEPQRAFGRWNGLEGFSYGNLMRVCKKPGCAGLLVREGEYGWDGWLGVYFANFPREKMTILMGMQRKDTGTFELTRRLRNLVLAEVL